MTTRENLARIFALLRPYKGRQIQTSLSMIAGIVLTLAIPLVWRYLIDDVILKKQAGLLVPVVLASLAIFIASACFNFLTSYLFNVMGQNIVRDVRRVLFSHLLTAPFRFFTDQGTGRIMSRVLNDVSTIGGVVSAVLLDLVIQTCTLIAIFAIMLYMNWRLTLVGMVSIPLYVLVIRFFNRRLRGTSYLTMVKHAEISSALQESVSGIKEIRAFNREQSEVRRFGSKLSEFLLARVWLGVLSNSAIQIGFVVSSISTLLIMWYGGLLVLREAVTIGTLMAFWAYLGQLYGPINKLFNVNVQLQESAAAFTRLDEILTVAPTVRDKPCAAEMAKARGEVAFEDVVFSYDGGKPVLDHLSLSIAPGERVAIVGRSGCGKTTLVALLMRFYDPLEGRVRLDGTDIAGLKLSDLRQHIALVSQDTFLFNATIRENIEFGNEDASAAEVEHAARVTGVSDFAEALPQGLQTQVGERGVCLSGGERQRIALARAIVRNAAVLVLDEATSQLDSRAEKQLQTALEHAMAGRTSIMIAHRLSTISGAGRILVLDGGTIAEEGTHGTLMEQHGLYFALYEEQAKLQQPT
ncbi:MAG TPA: ABC transporter ATP-binding protein [bacterium]|nr:ABC transporter ATP-binding protein [bacterium]